MKTRVPKTKTTPNSLTSPPPRTTPQLENGSFPYSLGLSNLLLPLAPLTPNPSSGPGDSSLVGESCCPRQTGNGIIPPVPKSQAILLTSPRSHGPGHQPGRGGGALLMINWMSAGRAWGGSPGPRRVDRTGEGTFSSHKRDATDSVPQGSASSDLCC